MPASLSGSTLFSTSGFVVVSVDSVNAAPRCSIVLYLLTFLHFFFFFFFLLFFFLFFFFSFWTLPGLSLVDSGPLVATPHSDFCFPILFFFVFFSFSFFPFLSVPFSTGLALTAADRLKASADKGSEDRSVAEGRTVTERWRARHASRQERQQSYDSLWGG